ncbi:hypothetical protein [Haloprofundus halobius]|uniref:hypothetical protein n=1 Tax=Haloprofundus halobius TaxID=2876194 RepID=UPI001CCE7D4E|nr:hypothetical protein [Haloprofundus halobius]
MSRRDAERQEREISARKDQQVERVGLEAGTRRGPAIDPIKEMEPDQILDKLTDEDLESEEYRDIVDLLKPYLSTTGMLAAHGDDYYSDHSNRLLNENLADRLIKGGEYPDLCTGIFREVAQEVDGDNFGGVRDDWSAAEKEAIWHALSEVKTDRESMGDGTFFEGITEMHVSTERHGDEPSSRGGGGLLSALNPFK